MLATNKMREQRSTRARIEDDPRWVALVARDRAADGMFFYSVRTTGVYCRPSCAARRPNPENVRFHRTAAEAQGAGFRPCRRCRPDRPLGTAPSPRQAPGEPAEIRFAVGESSLGSVLVARSTEGLCAILPGGDPRALVRDLRDRFPHATLVGGDAAFEGVVARVAAFLEGPAVGLDLPLDVHGTAFQRRVWRALQEIPAGATAAYSEVAARIGAPGGARAVARACAANTLAVAIPCHRVVRADGSPAGYRWGVERKQALLAREGVA
jgi:AraC family transcriptional regulator of adaptative response/methylated-DNA-[protein]-cysteine methyltransferase